MSDFSDLAGKCAIVTGGAGILGQAFCLSLAKAKVKVAMVDINKTQLESSVKKLLEKNTALDIKPFVCDVSDKASVENMITEVVESFGEINILHNNAATKGKEPSQFFLPFEEYSLDTWREIMSVNLDGMFLMAQAVGKQLIKQKKGGSIIQTASIYGVSAPDERIYEGSEYRGMPINTPAVYATSKAGVLGLSRYLATYWAKYNIRVNTLIPGGVESGQNELFQKKYSERVPLGRMGKQSELTGALLFLASETSSYMTGQSLVVDGGLTCW